MVNQLAALFRRGWTLVRLIAVISSSVAAILSSLLPLFLNTALSAEYLLLMLVFLSIAAVTFHGILTHLFNDYADFRSGTDHYSPAILSGGSRVIQKGLIRPDIVWQLGKWLAIGLFVTALIMAITGQYELTILIIVGVWAAASYSLPPLRLSYYPFLGEWLSLFPSMFFLGIAGPWIIMEPIPMWAVQNAVINTFVCMAWVMIHHIPDLEADKKATPVKRTSVVWFTEKFGLNYARFPALLYLTLAGLCAFWLGWDRLWAALILTVIIAASLLMVIKVNPKNYQQVTNCEKILLLQAIIIAVMLGLLS